MNTSNALRHNQIQQGPRMHLSAQHLARGVQWAWFVILLLTMSFANGIAPAHAAFPGTNGKIVFETVGDGNPEIYAMNPDGMGLVNLTNHSAADKYPAVSPDGTKIVFISDRDGNEEVYVMNADGSNVTRLTNDGAIDRDPAWSPDGSRIAFSSLRSSPWKIFSMDAADLDNNGNGDNLVQLTNNAASDYMPAWSPDGSRIAFGSDRTGYNQIFVMDAADGSNQTRLTNDTAQNFVPNWSPDGSRLVFVSTRAGNYDIYTMDPADLDNDGNGDNQAQLTGNVVWNFAPVWSPDGTRIAFQSNRTGDWEIFVMNADGSAQTNLTNSAGDDTEADWGAAPVNPTLQITIDIKPGDRHNIINPRSIGVIAVAILTTNTFDAQTVDRSTVRFGPYGAMPLPRRHSRLIDVDHDGDRDLVLLFRTRDTGIRCGDTSAVLTGTTLSAQAFMGSDSVRTVGCR